MPTVTLKQAGWVVLFIALVIFLLLCVFGCIMAGSLGAYGMAVSLAVCGLGAFCTLTWMCLD